MDNNEALLRKRIWNTLGIEVLLHIQKGPVVQWIELQIPVLLMGVRISPGSLIQLDAFN